MATLALEVVRQTDNLEKFVATVVPRDIQKTLQYLFLQELEGQEGLGAKPSAIIIDGGRGQLINVQRRAQAFFSNSARLIKAAHEAWELLVRLTPVKSGAGRRSYSLYLNNRPVGDENAITQTIQAMAETDAISIVGPGVAYGRKLYWRPLGKARKAKKKIGTYRKGGQTTVVKAVSTVPIHRQVKRALQRKYRDLFISDAWVPLAHGTGKIGERWPAITLAFKGRVH